MISSLTPAAARSQKGQSRQSRGSLIAQAGAAGDQGDLVGDDERRVETDSELADQLAVLGLVAGQVLEELARTRAGDGADRLAHLLAAHTDAVVADRDRAGLLVDRARAQEQARFIDGMIQHVKQPARQADGRAGADAKDHVADLADRVEGQQALQVMLHQRHHYRADHGDCAKQH